MNQQQSNRDNETLKARNTVKDWSSEYGASNKASILDFSVNETKNTLEVLM
jgi:hypothetical protein